MENLELYVSVAVTFAGLFASSITFMMKFLKSIKAKKNCEQMLKIMNEIIPLIEEAERFSNYSGIEKKEYVMTRARKLALDDHIKVNLDAVSEKVEELVGLTKQVNTKRSYQELQKITIGERSQK